jgi:hypothetical protein
MTATMTVTPDDGSVRAGEGSCGRAGCGRPLPAGEQARQPGIFFPELADPVDAYLDRFRVQHAVAALGTLPYPCPAQLGGEHRRVGAGMTQFIAGKAGQVPVRHEPRTTADGRNRGSQDTKFSGRG